MTTRKKKPVEEDDDPTISPRQLKWLLWVAGAVLGLLLVWWQVWDRVESHWRREEVQKAIDAKVAAEIVAAKEKAASDLAAVDKKATDALSDHLKADARSRAWTLFAIQDFRAAAETRWAEECIAKKLPADVCRDLDRKATASRQQAQEARTRAMEASKESP